MMLEPHRSGPYAGLYWALILCNVACPQAAVVREGAHHRRAALFVICDHRQRRHVARALRHRRHQPAAATSCRRRGACTAPTIWDWATFVGTIGLFLTLLFLFIRFLPMISIFEMRDAAARGQGAEEDARMSGDPRSYGLMAEFATPRS